LIGLPLCKATAVPTTVCCDTNESIEAQANINELSKASFSTTPLVWHAVLAAAVFIAIVALIAAQPQPQVIDYLAGNPLPL
jgi:hypothetical protein